MLQKRILLVDDEENIRNTYGCLLTEKGFFVVTSDSVKNARKEFFSSQFDLVITDLGMTEDSGYTLVKEVREKSPATPIIILTGSMKTKLFNEYLSMLGVHTMIEKTCSDRNFISHVMDALGLKDD
jgi:DNA-binding NtrC family response regulator